MLKIFAKHAKLLATVWLLLITILFFLPGSALPKENWLSDVHFDKFVHLFFFAVLLFFWRFLFPAVKKFHWLLLIGALIYGVGVELVQHYFISNRAFDGYDVAADMAGAAIGVWLWQGYIKK